MLFRSINEQGLTEGLVTLSIPQEQLIAGQAPALTSIQTTFNYRPINWTYYQDNELDAGLAYYAKHYNKLNLLYPIASLRCIQNLRKIAQDKLFLLATDKGYGSELGESLAEPELAFHGSFSMMVNFHAVGLYFKQAHGDCYYQNGQQSITSCAFVLNQQFDDLPQTRQALDTYLNHFSPGNLFNYYKHICATQDKCDMSMVLSHLKLSFYDPQIFDQMLPLIEQLLTQCDQTACNELVPP